MFLGPSPFLSWKSGRNPEYCCCTLELLKKQYKIEINKKAIGKVFQRNSSIDLLCHNPFVYLFSYFTVETKGIFATKRI